MKKTSIAANALLNVIKTIMGIIFPLITFPYISRVLSVDGMGQYNFSTSIISYFVLIASLGIQNYAIREGSRYRNNKKEFEDFGNDIYTINVIAMIVAYILLFISLLCIPKLESYKYVIYILSFQILFNTIGISWVYNVFEDFLFITIASVGFQALAVVLMFIFVKTSDDVGAYAAITTFANAGVNVIYRLYSKKYCSIKYKLSNTLRQHIKPIMILFSTSVTATVYVNSGTTVLGFLAGDYYVGLYSVSSKIYTIVKQVILAIVVVAMPRASSYVALKSTDRLKSFLNNIFNLLLLLCIPALCGMIMLSKEMVELVAGRDYFDSTIGLQLLSVALIFSVISSFSANCVLVVNRFENYVLKATAISCIVNILSNILLIPMFKQNAAAFSTLLSESIMAIMCFKKACSIIPITIKKESLIPIVVGSAGVCVVCKVVPNISDVIIIQLLIKVFISVIIYGLINLLLKNPIFIDTINKRKFEL